MNTSYPFSLLIVGNNGPIRGSDVYLNWLRVWYKIANPVYFYSDNKTIVDLFLKIRSKTNFSTFAVHISRSEMWSFNMTPEVARIFAQKSYPQFHPNTVVPEYAIAQHAKFELLNLTIHKFNISAKQAIMWMDVGAIREYQHSYPCGKLVLPPTFNQSTIGAFRVGGPYNISCNATIHHNLYWISGHMLFGFVPVMKLFIEQYRRTLGIMLSKNLMGTDQQVNVCAYGDSTFPKPLVPVQEFHANQFGLAQLSGDPWFYLCYAMRCEFKC